MSLDNKEEAGGQLESILEELQTIRDEIRVRIHLAGMDLKDVWNDLESRIQDIENQVPGATATQKLREAATELRDAFQALRAKLS